MTLYLPNHRTTKLRRRMKTSNYPKRQTRTATAKSGRLERMVMPLCAKY